MRLRSDGCNGRDSGYTRHSGELKITTDGGDGYPEVFLYLLFIEKLAGVDLATGLQGGAQEDGSNSDAGLFWKIVLVTGKALAD